MKEEFSLKKERRKLFETELLGHTIRAGRIYRKILTQDEEFIKRLKIEWARDIDCDFRKKIDKLAGVYSR